MKTATHHLNRLRAKPDHVKRRIAFFASLGVTFIIFIFWIISFSIGSPVYENSGSAKVSSPLSSFSASVGNAWDNFRATFFTSRSIDNTADSNGLEVAPGGSAK